MSTDSSATLPGMMLCARQHTATVKSVRQMAQDTWAVKVGAPELAAAIVPGQFFMIRPVNGSDPLLGRPFALFDVYHDADGEPAGVEFGFVIVGKLTTLMSHWRSGDQVSLWGPLGNGFPVPECRHLICVAGGIGQTPFLGVIREAMGLASYGNPKRLLAQPPQSVSLCYGVRSAGHLAGLDEFCIPGLNLQLATDDGSAGHHGYVTDLLSSMLKKVSGTLEPSETTADIQIPERSRQLFQPIHVYCCGPELMMKAVAELCGQRAVPCWLSLETPMACGFGACFSCVTKVREPDGSWDYRRTCVEGPVFRAEKLVL